MISAKIITIGDEILIGQIVDTNSTFISKQLINIAIEVSEILSISDEKESILNALNNSLNKFDIVITTGGLGPTNDDITKEVFVPITLGGGIKNIKDIEKALNSGADKVAINSSALENPKLISEASNRFGASTIVSYIEAKKISHNKWEPYKYCGREKRSRFSKLPSTL